MMLVTIAYLACAAFVLIHIARAPTVDDDERPVDPRPPDGPATEADKAGVPKPRDSGDERAPRRPMPRIAWAAGPS